MASGARHFAPPVLIAARRELWLYHCNKPNKVPPADSPNRPVLARLWWACFLATKRRPKLRSFTYCGVRFGVVYVGNRLGVMGLGRMEVMVLSPSNPYALATMLGFSEVAHA